MTADRPALDRERHVPIGTGPDVAEARADDAAAKEVRSEAHVLLARDIGEHRRGRMHRHHALLAGHVDVLSATCLASREECEQRARCGIHPGPERRLRQRRADRRTARLTCEPEAAARRGDLEVGRGRLRERPARAVRRDGHDDETLTLASLTDTLPSVAEEGPLPLGPLPLHARIDEQRGLHDDVRITKERRARLLVLAAHDDAALVRVERDPHESAIRIRFITNERRDAPDRIAFRRLRFHDVRAKVGEDAAALRDRGRGPLVGVHDLDDAKAVEHRLKHRWA